MPVFTVCKITKSKLKNNNTVEVKLDDLTSSDM